MHVGDVKAPFAGIVCDARTIASKGVRYRYLWQLGQLFAFVTIRSNATGKQNWRVQLVEFGQSIGGSTVKFVQIIELGLASPISNE
jgi:predicted alpha/beta-fold hydrolase